MVICNHKWVFEYCYGISDKPDKICNKCTSRIVHQEL
jgi:hypothetical protein